jgi:hypothetical protein
MSLMKEVPGFFHVLARWEPGILRFSLGLAGVEKERITWTTAVYPVSR